jgi:uncharacterized protein DUF4252
MKLINPIRMIALSLLFSAAAAIPAYGQQARLRLDNLDRLSAGASELVDVIVDKNLLQLAAKFFNPKRSPDEAKIKELIEGLEGVFVKRFAFDQDGGFTEADIEAIRSQLRAPGWSRIVGVRSKKKTSINIDVFLMSEGAIIKGLAVLAVEPRALTVVNVVGPIDIEKLSQLEGKFGIPKFDLMTGGGDDKEKPEEKKPPAEDNSRTERKPPELKRN